MLVWRLCKFVFEVAYMNYVRNNLYAVSLKDTPISKGLAAIVKQLNACCSNPVVTKKFA
jgi:hypothetical protein